MADLYAVAQMDWRWFHQDKLLETNILPRLGGRLVQVG